MDRPIRRAQNPVMYQKFSLTMKPAFILTKVERFLGKRCAEILMQPRLWRDENRRHTRGYVEDFCESLLHQEIGADRVNNRSI